jgi:hypothetical protein
MDRQTRSCKLKARYRVAWQAREEAAAINIRKGTNELMGYYKCEFCGGWHVGRATKYILAHLRVVKSA